jgi:uncharacterized protein (TIGR02117 family)
MVNATFAVDIEIYVVSHRYHSGIVIPGDYIKLNYLNNSKKFLNAEFIEFGYGDRDYYMSTDPSVFQGMNALFLPTESVVHVVRIDKSLEETFPASKLFRIKITEKKLGLLKRYIFESFKYRNIKNKPVGKGKYPDSYFYAGSRDFYVFNTCNSWVAKALKYSGYDIHPNFITTQGSLERRISHISE